MSNITRRQFIQGVAAGVAGIGVSSLFPSLTPEAEAVAFRCGKNVRFFVSDMILTVLVARGSAPISRRDSLVFGGSTSCYMVRAGGETVFLDAGTELQAAPSEYTKPPFFC